MDQKNEITRTVKGTVKAVWTITDGQYVRRAVIPQELDIKVRPFRQPKPPNPDGKQHLPCYLVVPPPGGITLCMVSPNNVVLSATVLHKGTEDLVDGQDNNSGLVFFQSPAEPHTSNVAEDPQNDLTELDVSPIVVEDSTDAEAQELLGSVEIPTPAYDKDMTESPEMPSRGAQSAQSAKPTKTKEMQDLQNLIDSILMPPPPPPPAPSSAKRKKIDPFPNVTEWVEGRFRKWFTEIPDVTSGVDEFESSPPLLIADEPFEEPELNVEVHDPDNANLFADAITEIFFLRDRGPDVEQENQFDGLPLFHYPLNELQLPPDFPTFSEEIQPIQDGNGHHFEPDIGTGGSNDGPAPMELPGVDDRVFQNYLAEVQRLRGKTQGHSGEDHDWKVMKRLFPSSPPRTSTTAPQDDVSPPELPPEDQWDSFPGPSSSQNISQPRPPQDQV